MLVDVVPSLRSNSWCVWESVINIIIIIISVAILAQAILAQELLRLEIVIDHFVT